jgi:hypothetical protein
VHNELAMGFFRKILQYRVGIRYVASKNPRQWGFFVFSNLRNIEDSSSA